MYICIFFCTIPEITLEILPSLLRWSRYTTLAFDTRERRYYTNIDGSDVILVMFRFVLQEVWFVGGPRDIIL